MESHSPSLEHLTHQLHQANERYHARREEWEKWLGASEYRHTERVEAAREQLRGAERDVEAIEEQIKKMMRQ